MDKHYKIISKPSVISVIVFAIVFEIIFVGGYVAADHTYPSLRLCALMFCCFFAFLSLVCSKIMSVLFLYIKDVLVWLSKEIAHCCQNLFKFILRNLGYILLLICLSFVMFIFVLVNQGNSMSQLEIFLSFFISLTATFVGVFLIYAFLRPKLKVNPKFTTNLKGYLCVTVTNMDLFKAYNLKAYLDFCRTDDIGMTRTKKIELKRDTVGVIRNRFSEQTDKEYVFKSNAKFVRNEKYDRVRFRVIASHQISNVQIEFEESCNQNDIL